MNKCGPAPHSVGWWPIQARFSLEWDFPRRLVPQVHAPVLGLNLGLPPKGQAWESPGKEAAGFAPEYCGETRITTEDKCRL